MPTPNRKQLARDMYGAYETGDRDVAERIVADDFEFFAPPDPGIDRDTYFERCWPNAGTTDRFDYIRLIEHGDEVIVTYELTKTDGKRFRNTEVLTFEGERLKRAEVYFGWDVA
jgi:ketosteroid isomerase-like protein